MTVTIVMTRAAESASALLYSDSNEENTAVRISFVFSLNCEKTAICQLCGLGILNGSGRDANSDVGADVMGFIGAAVRLPFVGVTPCSCLALMHSATCPQPFVCVT